MGATTMLLGDLVGARLIAHTGSLVSQASAKNKGKISRKLAAKAALAIRSDALAEEAQAHVGIELMDKMQKQFNNLEGKSAVTNAVKQAPKTEKYENTSKVVKYEAKDSSMPEAENVKVEVKEEPNMTDGGETPSKKEKKKKKKKTSELDVTVKSEAEDVTATPKSEKKKKKKKKLIEEIEEVEVKEETETPKKKKKRKAGEPATAENGDSAEPEKKKKKKKKKSVAPAEE